MARKTLSYPYEPEYAIPPGWLLESHLEARDMSQAECARRCGRSPKLISEIVSGKAPIEPDTALQLEKVLGLRSEIWLGIEKDYRLHIARQAEAERASAEKQWLKSFPVSALVARNLLAPQTSVADRVDRLLAFFGVASVEAWEDRFGSMRVAFRHSPSVASNDKALATWLRFGEIEADTVECGNYDASGFREALRSIRGFTKEPAAEAWSRARNMCRETGVILIHVKPFPNTAVSGAARWLAPRKALIQLSGRYRTNDQLWFSFFHEAAHLLLHSKRTVFVNSDAGGAAEASAELETIEREANEWAANWLVPTKLWTRFAGTYPQSKAEVNAFAEEQGIAPGLVVDRLQREGLLPWSHLNGLKGPGLHHPTTTPLSHSTTKAP